MVTFAFCWFTKRHKRVWLQINSMKIESHPRTNKLVYLTTTLTHTHPIYWLVCLSGQTESKMEGMLIPIPIYPALYVLPDPYAETIN